MDIRVYRDRKQTMVSIETFRVHCGFLVSLVILFKPHNLLSVVAVLFAISTITCGH